MRLDASYLNYLTREEFRVLVAIEMGMKNHEFVPAKLINSIANLKTGNTYKIIKRLLKLKFIQHVSIKYDGYKLNYSGYDYLALQTFVKRGTISEVVGKLGVGKQSDIYTCLNSEGEPVVLKFTRLGRTSFRTIKLNRDYIQNRTSYNWLYLSRISSTKEYAFMQKLYQAGFPTPVPLDWNRHGVVMSLINGPTLTNIVELEECERVFKQTLDLLVKFAQHGLIHSDFNEFNLILDSESGDIRVIDFPQCVSTSHHNAEFYFNRDVECIYTFFDKLGQKLEKVFNVADYPMPELKNIELKKSLDTEVKASGYLDEVKHAEINWKQLEEYEEFMRNLKRDPKLNEQVDNQQSEEEEEEHKQIEEFEKEKEFENNNIEQMAQQVQKQIKQIKGEEKQGQKQFESDEEESQEEEEEVEQRFKGMTQYQIRQLIKQQKLKARSQKKKEKEEENVHDMIKEIARRKPRENKKITKNKNKGINKVNPYDIMI